MYMLPTTVAIVASVQPVMRHSLGWRRHLIKAPEIMNVAAMVIRSRQIPVTVVENRSRRTPVDPYAAIAGSTQFLTTG